MHRLPNIRSLVYLISWHINRFFSPNVSEVSETVMSVFISESGIMSENIGMWKIAYFYMVLCAILTIFVCNFHLSTKLKIIDAKIAHSLLNICAIFRFNVQNRTLCGFNPITVASMIKPPYCKFDMQYDLPE